MLTEFCEIGLIYIDENDLRKGPNDIPGELSIGYRDLYQGFFSDYTNFRKEFNKILDERDKEDLEWE